MRERPILFSGEMVRAILEDRKTQTRRLARTVAMVVNGVPYTGTHKGTRRPDDHGAVVQCPYGEPGDRLWVREAWGLSRPTRDSEGIVDDEVDWSGPIPKTDPRGKRLFDDWCVGYAADGGHGPHRPSIHMPRWASRLLLDVTAVRVERLHEITDVDAHAEGVELARIQDARSPTRGPIVDGFANLWDRINSERAPWSLNPWVWVVSFRRCA